MSNMIDTRVDLAPPALETLALLNPNITHLRLDFCGQLDDTAFTAFTTSLPHLKRIELLGPFLVRVAGWKAFLTAHPDLEGWNRIVALRALTLAQDVIRVAIELV